TAVGLRTDVCVAGRGEHHPRARGVYRCSLRYRDVHTVVSRSGRGTEAGDDGADGRHGPARRRDLTRGRAAECRRATPRATRSARHGVDEAGRGWLVLRVGVRIGADLTPLRGDRQRKPLPAGNPDQLLEEPPGLVRRVGELIRRAPTLAGSLLEQANRV